MNFKCEETIFEITTLIENMYSTKFYMSHNSLRISLLKYLILTRRPLVALQATS